MRNADSTGRDEAPGSAIAASALPLAEGSRPRSGRPAAGIAALALGLSLALGLARPARAEDAPKEPDLELLIGDEIAVPDLLKATMLQTKKAIVWSDQDKAVTSKKIQGAQRLKAPGDKLFEMIRGLLTFQEIVLVPIGPKGYEVWVAIDARLLQNQFILKNKPVYVDLTGPPEIVEAKIREIENQDGLFVATTLKVKNID